MGHLYHTPISQDSLIFDEGQGLLRDRQRRTAAEPCFLGMTGLSHELTATETTCTRQDEARQNPSMDGGGGHKVPPLTEEILSTDSFWERGK